MGSEPGMGWNWIVSLAQYCDCHVISEGEFRPQVEQWLALPENNLLAQSMHLYWLPIGGDDADKCARIRRMCWNQGDWRFYYYYRKWQKRAARKADEIVNVQPKNRPIQILHQLNMIGFREPGCLWWVARKNDIPLVWGPIDAKAGFPMAYAQEAPLKVKAFLALKNIITRLQLQFMPRVRRTAAQASLLLSASSDSQQSITRYWHRQSILMNETGCSVPKMQGNEQVKDENLHKNTFDILWCGKMDFRKQLDLAIRAVAQCELSNVVLHVVGDGDDAQYRKLAKRLQVNVRWYGRVSHAEVQRLMQLSDVLLFTSVAEGTPHVVTEALANGLPVICHKTCGQGDVVNEQVGITCPIDTPEKSITEFANALNKLHSHPDMLERMKMICVCRARELNWKSKASQIVDLYQQVIDG